MLYKSNVVDYQVYFLGIKLYSRTINIKTKIDEQPEKEIKVGFRK